MKPWLSKLLCLLVGHQYDEWRYVSDTSCQQFRTCQRDGHKDERNADHNFSEWRYIADGCCQQVRVCKRDGYAEQRIFHILNPPQFYPGLNCQQVQICSRDGFIVSQEIQHNYSPWQYISDNSCKQIHICIQCNQQEERFIHQWIPWYPIDAATHRRYCLRDGSDEVEAHSLEFNDVHEYVSDKYQDGIHWIYYRIKRYTSCRTCGYSGEWVINEGWFQDTNYLGRSAE